MKKNNKTKPDMTIIVIVAFTIVVAFVLISPILTAIPGYIEGRNYSELVTTLATENSNLMNKIKELEEENQALEDESNDNIMHIYDRVREIQKSSQDEIRGEVIKSIKKDMKSDVITRKASVLALLSNYKELENDFEVQIYLSRNMDINLEMEKNLVLINDYIDVLHEYEKKIESINKDLDANKLKSAIQ